LNLGGKFQAQRTGSPCRKFPGWIRSKTGCAPKDLHKIASELGQVDLFQRQDHTPINYIKNYIKNHSKQAAANARQYKGRVQSLCPEAEGAKELSPGFAGFNPGYPPRKNAP